MKKNEKMNIQTYKMNNLGPGRIYNTVRGTLILRDPN